MKWMQPVLSFLFKKKLRIRAVILEDGDLWAVQGLDYDIAAQGDSVHEAMQSFQRVVIAQVLLDLEKKRIPFADIPKAPDEFWEMFDEGVLVSDPHKHEPPAEPDFKMTRVELQR